MTWSYDNTYQLTRERRDGDNSYDVTYTYDAVGNRATKVSGGTTTTYTYDADNKMSTFEDSPGITTSTYDSNGNQVTKEVPGGNITTYTYNYENKMTRITYPDASLNTFTYDGDGKRLQKQDSAGTLRFVYDHQGPTGLYDLAEETDGSNNLVAFYTQGPMLLAMRRGGNSHFYHDDALGSTSAITSSDETTTSTYKYYAFGEVVASSGTLTNPFKYVGGLGYYWDPDSGLLLLRARYYWASAGRFVSYDPARGGRNCYVYVASRPARLVDASGYQVEWGPGEHLVAAPCPAGYTDLGVTLVIFDLPPGAHCLIELPGDWELIFSKAYVTGVEAEAGAELKMQAECHWRRDVYLRFDVKVDVKEHHKCQKKWWEWCWFPLGWVPRYDVKFPWRELTLDVKDKYRLGVESKTTYTQQYYPGTYEHGSILAEEKCKEHPPQWLPDPHLAHSFGHVLILPGNIECTPVTGWE